MERLSDVTEPNHGTAFTILAAALFVMTWTGYPVPVYEPSSARVKVPI
jgi:hypothetical protein